VYSSHAQIRIGYELGGAMYLPFILSDFVKKVLLAMPTTKLLRLLTALHFVASHFGTCPLSTAALWYAVCSSATPQALDGTKEKLMYCQYSWLNIYSYQKGN
jgi:hypothetical protein